MAVETPAELLSHLEGWLIGRQDIRTAILTGSMGRNDGTSDDLSDLDVEIFCTDPDVYTQSDAWMGTIRPVWVYEALPSDDGLPNRLIIFEGGLKVDFQIKPTSALGRRLETELYARGYRVLLDRDGVAQTAGEPSRRLESPTPTEEQFRLLIELFWFEAYHVAKYLRRDDPWPAKARDWGIHEVLLSMLEWQARAEGKAAQEIRHLGIGMRGWVESDVWLALTRSFGSFDPEDSWRALAVTVDLFERAAPKTAAALGYSYPIDLATNMSSYIRSLDPTRPMANSRDHRSAESLNVLSAEDVAYWFFRLNGCLTIRNFLVHRDGPGSQRTDADLIAVRFPFREELNMTDHPLFGGLRSTTMMFAEIKSSGVCRLNGPWKAAHARNLHRVLGAMGPFGVEDVDSVASELYASGGATGRAIDVSMVAIAERESPDLRETHPLAVQLSWGEVLDFLYHRLVDYRMQKADHNQWEMSGHRLYQHAVQAAGLRQFRDAILEESGVRADRPPAHL